MTHGDAGQQEPPRIIRPCRRGWRARAPFNFKRDIGKRLTVEAKDLTGEGRHVRRCLEWRTAVAGAGATSSRPTSWLICGPGTGGAAEAGEEAEDTVPSSFSGANPVTTGASGDNPHG